MSIAADFILVEPASFEAVLAEEAPCESRTCASWNGLTEVNVVQLWSILLDEEYSEERRASAQMITSSPHGEKWLFVFPKELVMRLAQLDSATFYTVSSRWAATEEFQWGWQAEDVDRLLKDLVTLSKAAISKEQALVLWGSL